MPVQINGKVRSRLTVPADDDGVGAGGARARRSGGEGAYAGEDDPEGRRGERQACLAGGSVRHAFICVLVLAVRELGLRLRARRPRFVPARLHQGRRYPAVREPQQLLAGGAGLTEKVRIEFIGRGKYQSSLTHLDPTPCCRGDPRHLGPAGRLQRTATGFAVPLHLDDEGCVHRCADERGAVVERRADVPGRIRALDAR